MQCKKGGRKGGNKIVPLKESELRVQLRNVSELSTAGQINDIGLWHYRTVQSKSQSK